MAKLQADCRDAANYRPGTLISLVVGQIVDRDEAR